MNRRKSVRCTYTLDEYIAEHHNGNRSEFARAQGVSRQQVNEWITKKFIVVDGALYSSRRVLESLEAR